MIYDELKNYIKELELELSYASNSLVKGDWKEALEVAKSHKGLIASIVLPLIVLTRSPAAFIWGKFGRLISLLLID